ncbi:MAG: ferritin-like domain-containing protein [Candidatus Binatia bacterium]
MGPGQSWSDWWRRFLGAAPDTRRIAIEVLSERYIDESQQVARFTEHAEKMQYPQFRQRLLAIAANQAEHVEKIGEKIKQLGGRLPGVPPLPSSEKNSWQYLLEALNEQQRGSAERLAQAQSIRDELPEIAELLMQINEDGVPHRVAIRDMLMKSDPQSLSHWLA